MDDDKWIEKMERDNLIAFARATVQALAWLPDGAPPVENSSAEAQLLVNRWIAARECIRSHL